MPNNKTRTCQSCKASFVIDAQDFSFYEKIKVPPPTWCWRCRAMRRLSFRNMQQLYERTCAGTGKKILSLIPPDAPMPVYDSEYWRSDSWDATEYARDYDFSRPFFTQFLELFKVVPQVSTVWDFNKVDSDYSLGAWVKRCYLCFDSGMIEDSLYGVSLHDSKQCMDMVNCELCELCYYCINTNESYKTFFSRNCTSCTDTWFSQDCVGCTNIIGCTGLRNKSYYIFNKPYSKEEYASKLTQLQLDTFSGVETTRRESEALWLRYPVKFQHSVQAKDCTGDYIYNATEIRNCFFVGNSQNCAYSQSIIYGPIRDSMDLTSVGLKVELDYESVCTGNSMFRVMFGYETETLADSQYVMFCKNGTNLFGCIGIRSKDYCILNKQYSKEEYHELVPRIIRHMHDMPYTDGKGRVYKYGEFFPPEFSPFSYSESQGQQYFPLTKEEADRLGYKWREPQKRSYSITKTSETLPDSIADVNDSILKEIIQCVHDEKGTHGDFCGANCSTAFKVTPQELQFYKKLDLPLPRLCFNCRHWDRVAWRNWPQLYKRRCMCVGATSDQQSPTTNRYTNTTLHSHAADPCPNEFETSYAPDRKEIVYCEECYQREVI